MSGITSSFYVFRRQFPGLFFKCIIKTGPVAETAFLGDTLDGQISLFENG